MKDFSKWWPILLVGLLLFAFLFMMREATPPPARPTEIAYSEFKQLLRDHRIAEIRLGESSAMASVKPTGGDLGDESRRGSVRVNLPSLADSELMPLIESSGAVLTVEPAQEDEGSWLWSLLPWVIFLGIYFWFWNRMQSNIAGRFGGRDPSDFLAGSASKEVKRGKRVTFDDVDRKSVV